MPKIAAATDGAEEPQVTGPKLVTIDPPPEAPSATPEPTAPPTPALQQELSLPNPNIAHAAAYFNETQLRLSTFEQAAALLNTEMDAVESRFSTDMANLTAKRDAVMADLNRRLEDISLAKKMAAGSVEIYQKEMGQ